MSVFDLDKEESTGHGEHMYIVVRRVMNGSFHLKS